jgi:hypothetical protein
VQTLRLLFSNKQATDGKVTSYEIWTIHGNASAQFVAGEGEVLEIQLPPPEQYDAVWGTIEVEWTTPEPIPAAKKAEVRATRISKDRTNEEARLDHHLEQLPVVRRRHIQEGRRKLRAEHFGRDASKVTLAIRPKSTVPPQALSSPAVRLVTDTEWQVDRNKQMCVALGRDQKAFPELCKK